MPIWFNPFAAFFPSSTTKPAAESTPSAPPIDPASSPSAAQAGLFATDGLITDGPLKRLRGATPPTSLADLSTNDPRNKSVVYKAVSGRGVRLNHGSVVEGSVDFGGLQPNYVIDLKHPKLAALLGAARALNTPKAKFADKVNGVVALVKKTLREGAYDAPAYLKLLADNRTSRTNITLGDYLTHGAGVCRENALLTHLALTEAGVESSYLYCHAQQGAHREDHAVAVAVDAKGRSVVVDSYNRNFHGFFLDDLLQPGGSQPNHKRLAGGDAPSMYGCALTVAPYPQYWVPVRALRAPPTTMPPVDELRDFRVVRPARL